MNTRIRALQQDSTGQIVKPGYTLTDWETITREAILELQVKTLIDAYDNGEFVTVAEAAELAGAHRTAPYDAIARGKLISITVGNRGELIHAAHYNAWQRGRLERQS